jgi:predicted phosphate transport protein (TIGR00153 family)
MCATGPWQGPARSSVPTPSRGDDVKLRLVPQGHDYFAAFSEIAANLDAAASLLVKLMSNFPEAKGIAREILEHEHVGDKLVHDVVHRLNNTFITPIDREDIYELVTTMDEILDNIEEAADSMLLYRVEAPTPQAVRQAEIVAAAAKVLRESIDGLEKRDGLHEKVIEINRLENDGDRTHRDAVASLFDDDMLCTDVIKWKDIYEMLESAIDECEHVANIVEGIVLKHN